MYTPIIGAGASSGPEPVPTPEDIMSRTIKLHQDYSELRQDLTGELNAVDDSMIRPAMTVKDFLAPMRRTIKKRDDRKVCRGGMTTYNNKQTDTAASSWITNASKAGTTAMPTKPNDRIATISPWQKQRLTWPPSKMYFPRPQE